MKFIGGVYSKHNAFLTKILKGKVLWENGREEERDNYVLRRRSTPDEFHLLSTPEENTARDGGDVWLRR